MNDLPAMPPVRQPAEARFNGECSCGLPLSVLAREPGGMTQWVACPQCFKRVRLSRVRGTYKSDCPCDARCLNARGDECVCSCGGLNHGKGFQVPAGRAAHGQNRVTLRAAKPFRERRCLGEVGRTIRGRVCVASVRPDVGHHRATLVTFHTNEGDVLRWFAPEDEQVTCKPGDTLILRARVERHERSEKFGDATLVTRCERVEVA